MVTLDVTAPEVSVHPTVDPATTGRPGTFGVTSNEALGPAPAPMAPFVDGAAGCIGEGTSSVGGGTMDRRRTLWSGAVLPWIAPISRLERSPVPG